MGWNKDGRFAKSDESGAGLKRDRTRARNGEVWGWTAVKEGRHDVVATFEEDTKEVVGKDGPRVSSRANCRGIRGIATLLDCDDHEYCC